MKKLIFILTPIIILSVIGYSIYWNNQINQFNNQQYKKFNETWQQNISSVKDLNACRSLLDSKKDEITNQYRSALIKSNKSELDTIYIQVFERLENVSTNLYDQTTEYNLDQPDYGSIYVENDIRNYNPKEFNRLVNHRTKTLDDRINELIRNGERMRKTYCPKVENTSISMSTYADICHEFMKHHNSMQLPPKRDDFEFEEQYLSQLNQFNSELQQNLTSCTSKY